MAPTAIAPSHDAAVSLAASLDVLVPTIFPATPTTEKSPVPELAPPAPPFILDGAPAQVAVPAVLVTRKP